MEKRVKVLFDNDCPTCTVGTKVAQKLDRAHSLTFVGMNSDEGKKLVEEHRLDMEKSAYALVGAEIHGKAAMVRTVLRHAGVVGFLASLPFRIPFFGDKLYEFLALHRKHVRRPNES